MRNSSQHAVLVILVASLARSSAPRAEEPPAGKWCSDLTTLPPNAKTTRDKVIYKEIEAGRFPQAIFPLGVRGGRMLFFDDQRRVLSERAATAVLENHIASHDLIPLWREATQQEFEVKATAASQAVLLSPGVRVNNAFANITYYETLEANQELVEEAEDQSKEYFSQAVCAFNSFQAARRHRDEPPAGTATAP